jgi:ferrous iron transport protein A
MTHGTKIQVINTKDRGTMIVKVRGTRFAIGRDISANIDVTEVK